MIAEVADSQPVNITACCPFLGSLLPEQKNPFTLRSQKTERHQGTYILNLIFQALGYGTEIFNKNRHIFKITECLMCYIPKLKIYKDNLLTIQNESASQMNITHTSIGMWIAV